MIRFTFVIIFLVLFLTGCASTKEMQEVIVDKSNKKEYVFPDEKYLKSCEELPLLKGNKPKDLYLWGIDASNQYNSCSFDKDVLSEWIKRLKKDLENN